MTAPTVFGRRHVVAALASFPHRYPDIEVDLRRPRTPEALMNHDCITVATPPAPGFVWRDPGVNRNQPLPVRGRYRTDDKDGMLQAALQGLGVMHIATWMACDHLRSGELVVLFPDEAGAPAAPGMPGIRAVRLPGRSHGTRAWLFIDHLRAKIGDTHWWDRLLQAPVAPATRSAAFMPFGDSRRVAARLRLRRSTSTTEESSPCALPRASGLPPATTLPTSASSRCCST